MQGTQLTLDQYASFLEQEQKWRLTEDEQRLLNHSYSYTRSDRAKEMPPEMSYLRNTKARQYRRCKTFEAYLNECERCRKKKTLVQRDFLMSKPTDDELTTALKDRLSRCYRRAIEIKLPFDLTLDWLKQKHASTSNCPVCNVSLADAGFQLDRHVPNLGYVQSNVNLLCPKCNRLKSDHTVDSLQQLIGYIKG